MDKAELLKKLSHTARINIPETEFIKVEEKISDIIKWSLQINKVDTTNVKPLFNVLEWLGNSSSLREDKITEPDNSSAILKNAPDVEDEFIAVPKIIEA